MNILKLVFISIFIIFSYGCASNAKYENMVYMGNINGNYDKNLINNIKVNDVMGGGDTNPLWTSEIDNKAFKKAVEWSLLKNGLLSKNGRYELKVILAEVDLALFNLDMAVTTYVNYILVDTKTNKIIFDYLVVSPYTATIGDAFMGLERLRLANEGAGKKSIESLLKKLHTIRIDIDKVSLTK